MPTINELLTSAKSVYQRGGFTSLAKAGTSYLHEVGVRKLHAATGKVNRGKPVFEEDWDVLVILDAARPDLMREVQDEYDFIDHVGEYTSPASSSSQWMKQTFTDEYADELAETAYVTGNPFTQSSLGDVQPYLVDEVWKYAWDDDAETIQPRPLTDRGISVWKEEEPNRMIIHYMQPHIPFVGSDIEFNQGLNPNSWGEPAEAGDNLWHMMKMGRVSEDEVWEGYIDNLRYVLDDVSILLNSIDAETVILSADHGNGMGEKGVYGHPAGIGTDALRQVPWIETAATDDGTHTPDTYENGTESNTTEEDVEERLDALGYK